MHRDGHPGHRGLPWKWAREDKGDAQSLEIIAAGAGLSPGRSPGALGMPRPAQPGLGGAEPALLGPGQLHLFGAPLPLVSGSGARELRTNPVPLAAGGRGLFLLVLPGPGSHTKHLSFLLIKLSPGDASVATRLAAFIRGRTGPSFGAGGFGCKTPEPGRAGHFRAEPGEVGWRRLHPRLPAEIQTAEMRKSGRRGSMKSRGRLGRGSQGRWGERQRDMKEEENEHTEYIN